MNKIEAMEFVTSTDWKGSSLGLERMRKIMDKLGNPQNDIHTIHVAGTNGKGSCCASLKFILMDAGYKVGMYTSPHLIDYEERFIIDDKMISEEDFCEAAEMVKKATSRMKDRPTEFEILTAMCFVYFKKMKVDVAIMEVGLGGRLDATNVIAKPDLEIIMNIGLEHTQILGDTLEKIAYEKAGIIKEDSDVVVYDNCKEVLDVFREAAKQRNARLKIADFSKIDIISEGIDRQCFSYGKYKNLKLNLLGKHQFCNAATVIEAIKVLNGKGYKISSKNIRNGFMNAGWDARLSILTREPLFVLDGAHNPQCAAALAESLPAILGKKKAVVLCGMLKDKDYESVMDMMIPFAKEFVTLTPVSPRALTANELAKVLEEKGQKSRACESTEEGIRMALDAAGEDGAVLAFGSLYLAGYIEEKFPEAYAGYLRKLKRGKRNNMSERTRKSYSKKIVEAIRSSKEYQKAKNILIYSANDGEVDLSSIANDKDKVFAYPICLEDCEMMAAVPKGDFIKNRYGIDEPDIKNSYIMESKDIDLVICPLVAFDEDKNRLGMGMGYYDRYLKKLDKKCDIIGVGFACQGADKILAKDSDIRMDAIVTEKGTIV